MGRSSIRQASSSSAPPPKRSNIAKKTDVKAAGAAAPAKRTKVRKMLSNSEEEVRLDYLVIEKIVARMHQGLSDDFRHEIVSHQFATALKSVHGKRPMSMSIFSNFDFLEIELKSVVPKPSIDRQKSISPAKGIIKFVGNDWYLLHMGHKELLAKLKNSWTKIFDRFKRFKSLNIHDDDKIMHKTLTNFAVIADGVHIHRLEMKTDFRYASQLLLAVAPHIKELKIEGNFSIGAMDSKEFWNAISMCSNLRCLIVTGTSCLSFEDDYPKIDLLSCLEVLKLKRFQGDSSGRFFDSAATILSAFQGNTNLQHLSLNVEPTLIASSILLPILSRLRYLSVTAVIGGSFDRPVPMSEILSILQALPDNGTLCVRLLLTCLEDEEGDEMLGCCETFLNLSDKTKKPIELVFQHLYHPLRYPDVDDMTYLIAEQEWFQNADEDKSVINHRNQSCIVRMKDAKVTISVVNE